MKKPLVPVLVSVVTLAVVAAIVFAVVAIGGTPAGPASSPVMAPASHGPESPSPSGTTPAPTSTPKVTGATPGGQAPDAGGGAPVFTSSSIQESVACPVPGEGPSGGTAESPTVALRWASSGATTAFVGVATTDAQAEPYAEVAASGAESLPFPCPEVGQQYTITLVGPGGATSTTTTVTNTGYRG